ncbi:MAG: prolipoprotein diacylglyceryl transferase [Pontiellaceae bacterium]|jgi:phosphatidylglycerol:prolipoprotein diacylglycerol transferase|nr:prolipoprotein diacylglyceryl transferase [Pontiellaceae bacterium]
MIFKTLSFSTASAPLAFWTHNLDPVVFHVWGPLAVRWYGISYLLGFLGAYLLLTRMSKRGEFVLPPKEVSTFILHIALYGVFLGGRLGYVLLYAWNTFIRDPLFALRVWEGGMASHGGMVGVILVMLWIARKQKISFWNLTDGLALAAPIGLFCGRIANFINGELWGRPTTIAWAVVFPQARDLTPTPRHPSQIYEALGEGLFLFILLQLIRRTTRGKREGVTSAAFLILYAIARIAGECFREPDSTVYFGGVTKGQLYSFFMIIGGIIILARKKLWKNHPPKKP